MNKIENTVWGMKDLLRSTGLDEGTLKQQIDELEFRLTEESYNRGLIENLVNCRNIKHNTLYIGDMEYIEDYEIATRTFSYEGKEFNTEEEYLEHIQREVNERVKKFTIELIEKIEEEDYEHWGIDDEDGDLYEDGFHSQEEAQERLSELREEFLEDYPTFDELDYEYDEVYYDYVYGYDYIDEDIAKKCGLGVLELSNGEQYLFLQGCGMDMSFQLLQYQALYFNAIDHDYVSKLDWAKTNLSKEEYNEVLRALGVDINRLKIEE